jgi:exopolyphosphatase/guanosine-5'-triphosphate,3'-diphosphate pyrophosphatase
MKISVIDLGYNSLKLVNYDVRIDNAFSAYSQHSVLARLGEGLDETGFLKDDAIIRTVKALKLLQQTVKFESVAQVLPVATSAVREAGNKDQFLALVSGETGFDFKVLSDREEALYSFAGSYTATNVPAGLFFDLGGGTLEMVIAEKSRVRRVFSTPLGGLRLTDQYASGNGRFSKKNYAKMSERILEILPDRNELPQLGKLGLVGAGGTVRAIARYHQMIIDYPLDKLHNYSMDMNSVEQIHRTLRKMSPKQIGNIPVIGGDRAKSIVAGSLVLQLMMRKLKIPNLIVSTHGLRDGVLSAFLKDPNSYEKGSVDSVLPRLTSDKPAALSATSSRIIKAFASRELLNQRDQFILVRALEEALRLPLYDPETLFYIIANRDSILTHSDQLLLALSLVRIRGLRGADWLYAKYKDMLDKDAKNTIKRISSMITLIEILEKTGSDLQVTLSAHQIRLRISPGTQDFPTALFKNTLKDFENAFKLKAQFSLSHSTSPRLAPEIQSVEKS